MDLQEVPVCGQGVAVEACPVIPGPKGWHRYGA